MQLRTVLPPLQPKATFGDSLLAVMSEKTTDVAVGFMAVLKVITTAAPGETPVAPLFGIVEIIVGCATTLPEPANSRSNTIRTEYNRIFIEFGNLDFLSVTDGNPA